VLSESEIDAFWKAAEVATKPFDAVLKHLLLTGCRLNEVAGMRCAELETIRDVFSDDFGRIDTWCIPGERTKNRRTHVVPLSPLARDILSRVERLEGCEFVFSTNQKTPVSGFFKIKLRLDAKMPGVAPWRIHDIRRSAATHMAEIGIAPHIIELCLNHVSGTRAGVAGIYNRSEQMEERRAAMERWAAHVLGIVGRMSHVQDQTPEQAS
jgi:integrase